MKDDGEGGRPWPGGPGGWLDRLLVGPRRDDDEPDDDGDDADDPDDPLTSLPGVRRGGPAERVAEVGREPRAEARRGGSGGAGRDRPGDADRDDGAARGDEPVSAPEGRRTDVRPDPRDDAGRDAYVDDRRERPPGGRPDRL
ncbi:hypothetical protein ACFRNH_37865, partial [Streptomyces sp. NPDC056785]